MTNIDKSTLKHNLQKKIDNLHLQINYRFNTMKNLPKRDMGEREHLQNEINYKLAKIEAYNDILALTL